MNPSFRSCVLVAIFSGLVCQMPGKTSATPPLYPVKWPCMEALGDQTSYAAGKPLVAIVSVTTIPKRDDGTDSAPEVAVVKMARDSSGKVYWEWLSLQSGDRFRPVWLDDPVSGTMFTWNVGAKEKIVTVQHYPGIHSRHMQELLRMQPWRRRLWAVPVCLSAGLDSPVDKDEISFQDLGTSRILETSAQGVLATRNDNSVTEERWYSSELELALTTRVIDPRWGTAVSEIKSLELSEPDPNLFRMPTGYKVREFGSRVDR
jgi:hypothetical protein